MKAAATLCGFLNHVICCLFCSILARHLLRLSIYSFTSMSAVSVPSPAIKITNLRRPFTEKALRSLLAEFGSYDFFWLSRIKDVCLLQYDSLASAARALPELNGRTWPEHGAPARTQRPCIHSMHVFYVYSNCIHVYVFISIAPIHIFIDINFLISHLISQLNSINPFHFTHTLPDSLHRPRAASRIHRP